MIMNKLIASFYVLSSVATALAEPFPLETRLTNAHANEVIEVPAGTYTLASGHYLPNGVKLIAEPGAKVVIQGGYGISTEGRSNCLIAGITFDANTKIVKNNWAGTAIHIGPSCVASNCIIRGAVNAVALEGTMTDCVVSN